MRLRPPLRAKRLLVASAVVLVPTLAFAQAGARDGAPPGRAALGAPLGRLDTSVLVGPDIPPSSFSVGPRVAGEVLYGIADLLPSLRLAAGGRASVAYHGGKGDASLWLLDAMPDARLAYAWNDLVATYADLGLGLALLRASTPRIATATGSAGGTDTTLALAFQFGAGVAYNLAPHLNFLGEIRVEVCSSSGASTFVTLPSVGLQWY